MKIQLTKEYQVITDELQFIVQRVKVTTATKLTNPDNIGKESWVTIGNFPNIQYCVNFIAKNIVLVNDDLEIIVDRLNELDAKVDSIREFLTNTRI